MTAGRSRTSVFRIQLSNSPTHSRSPDGIGGLQAAVLKNADASHRLWRNPGLSSKNIPDFASLHPGYKHARVIAPCLVRPRARRSFLFLFPRRGVRNDRAFHRARGARMCWHTGSPHAAFAAHGQWPSPTPKIVELNRASEADLRLRSARGWILRLAASLTGNCRLRRPRPDRASCRTGMHLDRPPVASASISRPTRGSRL